MKAIATKMKLTPARRRIFFYAQYVTGVNSNEGYTHKG
jgi:hypothetical protein